MQPARLITLATTLLLAPAGQALADTAARQDNSQFLVWAFLGMCALIVIVQLMPVFILAFGLVKGLFTKHAEPSEQHAVTHK
jgi:hypothetical protein